MIRWINNKHYVQIYLTNAEITGTYWYNKKKFNNLGEALFFGYDMEKKIFNFLGFDKKRKFTMLEMPFDDLVNAFFSPMTRKLVENCDWPVVGNEFGIILYKFNNKAKYLLNFNDLEF